MMSSVTGEDVSKSIQALDSISGRSDDQRKERGVYERAENHTTISDHFLCYKLQTIIFASSIEY